MEHLENGNIYLDAILADPLTEFYVTRLDSTVPQRNLQEDDALDELEDLVSSGLSSVFAAGGIEIQSSNTYTSRNGIDFIKVHVHYSTESGYRDVLTYGTINDYHLTYLFFTSFGSDFVSAQLEPLIRIVDSVQFDDITAYYDSTDTDTTAGSDMTGSGSGYTAPKSSYQSSMLERVVSKMLVALVLGGLAALFRKIFRKSKPEETENQDVETERNMDPVADQKEQDSFDRSKEWEQIDDGYEKTVLLADDSDKTISIARSKKITLTDMANPDQVYRSELKDSIVVGRSRSAEMCIPNDVGISRKHCRIYLIGDQLYLHDLGSVNPSIVNGNTVCDDDVPIKDGDVIGLGNTNLRISVV